MLDQLFGREGANRDGAEILKALQQAARERILILDGAMGTEIQGLGLTEDDFRGERFLGEGLGDQFHWRVLVSRACGGSVPPSIP